MKGVTIRIFHTRSAQEISAKRACPTCASFSVLGLSSLGSTYITFLDRFVPHLSFSFPPAPSFPLPSTTLSIYFCLVPKCTLPRCAPLERSAFTTFSHSATVTHLVQISHLAALPNACIPLPLSQTCGKWIYIFAAYTTLKVDVIYLSVHSHFHQAPDSPLAANRTRLGPLDLAPSKIQQKSSSPSPSTSPRRPPLPLTPPLTPSSLNDSASQGGFPATPTDLDCTNAALWRGKSKKFAQTSPPISGADDFVGDVTPTDRSYLPLAPSQQRESNSTLSCYLRLDTLPSRFLLVSEVVAMNPYHKPLS